MAIETLVQNYGWLTVFIGTFFEGETILILAAFAAHRGYMPLWEVIAAGFLGSLLGDQLYFYLGRRHSGFVLARMPSIGRRIETAHRLISRFQSVLILTFRFLYGLRTVLPFSFGMSPIPAGRFLALNIFGAAVWAISLGMGGYFFGSAFESVIGKAKTYELWGFGIIAGVGAAMWLYLRLRRRSGRRLPFDPDTGDRVTAPDDALFPRCCRPPVRSPATPCRGARASVPRGPCRRRSRTLAGCDPARPRPVPHRPAARCRRPALGESARPTSAGSPPSRGSECSE